MNATFVKRLKSLGWRVGMMTMAFVVAQLTANISTLQLSPEITIFLGLLLGELSKFIANVLNEKKVV